MREKKKHTQTQTGTHTDTDRHTHRHTATDLWQVKGLRQSDNGGMELQVGVRAQGVLWRIFPGLKATSVHDVMQLQLIPQKVNTAQRLQ